MAAAKGMIKTSNFHRNPNEGVHADGGGAVPVTVSNKARQEAELQSRFGDPGITIKHAGRRGAAMGGLPTVNRQCQRPSALVV
ncbi:MAG: hypothetical protein ACYDDP_04490 [Acidithiobacillus sp.]